MSTQPTRVNGVTSNRILFNPLHVRDPRNAGKPTSVDRFWYGADAPQSSDGFLHECVHEFSGMKVLSYFGTQCLVPVIPALPAWTRCYLCNQPLDPKDAHDVVWSEHRWCSEEQTRVDREREAEYDAKLDREIRDHYAMLDAVDEERNRDESLDDHWGDQPFSGQANELYHASDPDDNLILAAGHDTY